MVLLTSTLFFSKAKIWRGAVAIFLPKGTFVWGYSYSGLGITEYTEFQFRKERSQIWKRNTHGGGDLRTAM